MINVVQELRMASRNLHRNKSRTIVAVLTVAAGLIAYLLAGGFIEWIFENMRESTIHSQLGHIQIVKPGYMEKGIADPYAYLLPENAPEIRLVSQQPDVKIVAQRLAFSGLISFGDVTANFQGEGITPREEALVSDQINIRSGAHLSSDDERSVIIGEGLAKSLGAKTGDKIVLLATAANGTPNATELSVLGTFFTSSKEFDDVALRLPIKIAQKLMRVRGATTWVVLLDDTEKTNATVTKLRSKIPATEFEIIPWIDLADFYKKTVSLFEKQIGIIKAIIGLIIILTISNTQTMSVLERTTEIGTMLAVGSRRSGVLRMFLLEGLLIGVIGGLVGILIGMLCAAALSAIGIPMPPPPGMDTGFTAQIFVTPWLALDAFYIAFTTTLIASIIPAWKASRMNVVDALRCNQ